MHTYYHYNLSFHLFFPPFVFVLIQSNTGHIICVRIYIYTHSFLFLTLIADEVRTFYVYCKVAAEPRRADRAGAGLVG